MIRDKKGISIPISVFVLGVIAIFSIMMFSFHYSGGKVEENFLGVGLTETVLAIAEEVEFHRSNGFSKYSQVEYFEIKDGDGVAKITVREEKIVAKWHKKSAKDESVEVEYFLP